MNKTTLSEMLTSKRLTVPRYQRGYAWKSKHIEDFCSDLDEAAQPSEYKHFFGIVYLRHQNDRVRILDGQQRITTALIFVLCARNYLQKHDPNKFGDTIKDLDCMLSNNGEPRLTLSKTNHDYFKMLMNNEFTQHEAKSAINNDSNEKLYKAYLNLDKYVQEQGEKGTNKVVKLVRTLSSFTIYENVDIESVGSYTYFDLINDRGISLEQHELVKSYVFGKLDPNVDDHLAEELENKWDVIIQNIRKIPNYDLNVFLQHCLTLVDKQNPTIVKDKYVYKRAREYMQSGNIQKFVSELNAWSCVVQHLQNPKGHFMNQRKKSYPCEANLERLRKIGATAVYPLLMAGHTTYWKNGDYQSFNKLTEICLKYHLKNQTVAKTSVGKYQQHMFRTAQMLYNNSSNIDVVINFLVQESVSDDEARNILKNYKPKTSVASVMLELIEENISDKTSNDTVTIEHIMPKKIGPEWKRYIGDFLLDDSEDEAVKFHTEHYKLLGNLTLWNQSQNSIASNNLFADKQKEYKKTDYKITRKLADLLRWDEDAITARHEEFVNKILDILRIKSV